MKLGVQEYSSIISRGACFSLLQSNKLGFSSWGSSKNGKNNLNFGYKTVKYYFNDNIELNESHYYI